MRSERYLAWIHAGNVQGLMGGSVLAIFAAAATGFGMNGLPRSPLTVAAAALVGFAIGKGVGWSLLTASGNAAQSVYAPAAAGSYAQTHSNIDAMEVRGDYKGAVAAWEAVAVAEPESAWPLIRAGELYLRELAEPALALQRFRLARDLPGVSAEHQRYASQKIVDLYLGPLGNEGRALVELRRLIDQHPGTPEAEGARQAIRNIRERRGSTD